MQDDVTWKLSLLMDDELPSDEAIALLEQLKRDPQLQVKWFQYQLIRQALRNGDGVPSHPEFLERVQVALAREPDHQPQSATLPSSSPQRPALNRRMVLPVALAAAAVIVVLVWNRENPPASLKSPPLAQVASFQTGDAASRDRGPLAGPHHFSQIEDYLLAHSEDSLYLPGSQHMLSYARIVTHGGR